MTTTGPIAIVAVDPGATKAPGHGLKFPNNRCIVRLP
jgi:hypothetical protein